MTIILQTVLVHVDHKAVFAARERCKEWTFSDELTLIVNGFIIYGGSEVYTIVSGMGLPGRVQDRLTYIWRSWFTLDNLHGLSAILFATRDGSKIILTCKEKFQVEPSDNRLNIVLNVASTLSDDITAGIVGLFSCNSDENDSIEVENQLIAENIHLHLDFIVRRLRCFVLSESKSYTNCDELIIDGVQQILKRRQRSTLVAEFIDIVVKALKMKYLSLNGEGKLREIFSETISRRSFSNIVERQPEVALEWLRLIWEIGGRRWIDRIGDDFFKGMMHTGYIEKVMTRQPRVAREWIRIIRKFGGRRWIDRISIILTKEIMNSGYIREIINIKRPEIALERLRLIWDIGGRQWIEQIDKQLFESIMQKDYISEIMNKRSEVAYEWLRVIWEIGGRRWIDQIGKQFFNGMIETGYIVKIIAKRPEVAHEWIHLIREIGGSQWIDRIGKEFFKEMMHPGYIREIMDRRPEVALEWLRLIREVGVRRWNSLIGDNFFNEMVQTDCIRSIMDRRPEIAFEWLRFVREVGHNKWIIQIGDFYERIIGKNIGSVSIEYLGDIKWYVEITDNIVLMKELEEYVIK